MAAQLDRVPIHRRAAIHANFAVGWIEQAVDQFESGCLASAAAAEQHERLAARGSEIQVLEEHLPARQAITGVEEFDDGLAKGLRIHAWRTRRESRRPAQASKRARSVSNAQTERRREACSDAVA